MPNRTLAIGLGVLLAFAASAGAQTWTPLAHQPTFSASTALLLTDGTVMMQAYESGVWWRLTPDIAGSYINGTWSQLASLPAGYGPLYYASAVLADGRVVVEGGEYNNSGGPVWTSLGAIYSPTSNAWTSIAPPAGWGNIGDAQSVVLCNGTFMLANPFTTEAALLNASTLTWTPTGTGKTGRHDEEGWTLLPDCRILTVDANNLSNLTNSEVYDPATGIWSSAGSTIVKLPDTNADGSGSREVGPAVLRPNGTVFATGGTSNTAIYNSAFGSWSVGPTFPGGLDVADGPAALLPNGNVLVDASPGVFHSPSQFFEFNGTNLVSVPGPPNAPFEPSFVGRMLALPTGQILFTDGSADVEVYTASGTYQNAWQPTINSFSSSVTRGTANYSISGTQFNGLSQGAMYGDDAQAATNYPLVRITNNSTAHVSYARTHNHSTMAVATGSAIVSTQFDVPAGIETGVSALQVVANGIPSNPVTINVLDNCPGCGDATSWISVTGSDGNDCSQSTPCRTFSGALAKTPAGGEIDVLDSGDFGPVTINKSVSLVAARALGGIQAGTGTAITINAGPNDKVVLRGLTIEGLGTGSSGISFTAGGLLYVENCTINNFGGYGIEFAPTSGSGKLFVGDSIVRNNGVGATGGGLHLISTTGPGFVASVEGLRAENNVFGIKAEVNGIITIGNSLAANNGFSGFSATSSAGSLRMVIDKSVSTHNGTNGISSAGGSSSVVLSDVTVTDNQTGLAASGAIISLGNNRVWGNGTDGAPTQTIAQQ